MTTAIIGTLPQFQRATTFPALPARPGRPRSRAIPLRSESDHQTAVITWARRMAGVAGYAGIEFLHAIPNGAHRSKRTAARLKAEGVLPGVPDLFLPVPKGKHHGLYIEMKLPSGKLTEAQAHFLAQAKAHGYATFIAFSAEQAITYLTNYLTGSKHPIPLT